MLTWNMFLQIDITAFHWFRLHSFICLMCSAYAFSALTVEGPQCYWDEPRCILFKWVLTELFDMKLQFQPLESKPFETLHLNHTVICRFPGYELKIEWMFEWLPNICFDWNTCLKLTNCTVSMNQILFAEWRLLISARFKDQACFFSSSNI